MICNDALYIDEMYALHTLYIERHRDRGNERKTVHHTNSEIFH